jgi:menaquinone-specific isochorismate synthase
MTSLAADQESILYVRTVEIPDIPNLLSLLPAGGGLAWINGLATNQIGIVGWGEVTRSSFDGPERFSRAQRWWSQQCAISKGDDPIAFASFAFDKNPGTSVLVIPEVAIIRTQTGTKLTITSDVAISDSQFAGVLS